MTGLTKGNREMHFIEAEQAIKVIQDKFEAGEVEPVKAMQEVNQVLATVLKGLGRSHDDIDWVNRGGQW